MIAYESIIEKYNLVPHPEGGWFKRTYTSSQVLNTARGERICGSSILYYLDKGEKSRLHFLDSDEVWYFHYGSSLRMHLFFEGQYLDVVLGNSLIRGELIQYTVPRGTVFGAELVENKGSLLSCFVCPCFCDEDFHWGIAEKLIVEFPDQIETIQRLTSKA